MPKVKAWSLLMLQEVHRAYENACMWILHARIKVRIKDENEDDREDVN